MVFGTFFQVPQSLLSNSPQKRPTKWCFVMFLWDYCHFPLLPFIHSLPVPLLFCQVMPQVDLWNPLIVCCSPKGKCRQMDSFPTGSFLVLFSRLLWTSRYPEKLREKTVFFSSNSLLPHIISTQFISIFAVFLFLSHKTECWEWMIKCMLNVCDFDLALKVNLCTMTPKNLKLAFVFCN